MGAAVYRLQPPQGDGMDNAEEKRMLMLMASIIYAARSLSDSGKNEDELIAEAVNTAHEIRVDVNSDWADDQ